MAGKWDYSVITRIQQANDITDVIAEYMNLDKKGKELVGLCPFHTDHRPSLYVNPAKQIFKCFACSAGGDVIKFVQMKENLTFPQAVERLAQRAGISIEPLRKEQSNQSGGLDAITLAKLNTWAMKQWIENYQHPDKGNYAREYVASRRITEETARKWQLGLALDTWDDLVKKTNHKKGANRYLVQAGLAVEKERGGCYDKFRNRLMFPIVDVTGRVIGFGGRTLGDDPAKYMNSHATVLFDKSHSLYGLNQAREAITKTGTAVVAEGYTDVIMAHQCGVENVVAALGTSLTSGHAKILRRYAKRIVLLFDSDVAGKAAANRALEVCLGEKIDVQLAFVPNGKDPCDYLIEAGAEAFQRVIDTAEDVLEYKWKVLEEQLEKGQNLSDRTEAVREFLQTAAGAFETRWLDSISRTVILSRLGELLRMPPSRIEEEILKIQKQKRRSQRQENNEVAVSGNAEKSLDIIRHAQQEILEVLLHEPSYYERLDGRLEVEDFGPDPDVKEIADVLFGILKEGRLPEPAYLYGQIESTQTATLLSRLEEVASAKGDLKQRLEESIFTLEQNKYKREKVEFLDRPLKDDEELNKIFKKMKEMDRSKRNS